MARKEFRRGRACAVVRSHKHHPAMAGRYAVLFDPATAAIAVATTIVGAIDDARKGAADRGAAEFQARLLEQEAEQRQRGGKEAATRVRREGSRISARQRALLAGSGVSQSGTPLLVLSDIAADVERQAKEAVAGSGEGLSRQRAALKRRQGLNRQNTSFFRAGQSLLRDTGSFQDLFTGTGPTA